MLDRFEWLLHLANAETPSVFELEPLFDRRSLQTLVML
jgi:hypothetical protein